MKLRYSELTQEIADLAMRVIGRPAIGRGRLRRRVDNAAAVKEYLWSLQYTIAAGTSQIQRNLIAERILGLPDGTAERARWTFGEAPLPETVELADRPAPGGRPGPVARGTQRRASAS